MKLFKKHILFLLLLTLCLSCGKKNNSTPEVTPNSPTPTTSSNAPQTQWHKGYGTNNEEHIHEVMQTADDGYLGIGQTVETEGEDWSDILVIKLDKEGQFLWRRIIGVKKQFDVGICLQEVEDGLFNRWGKHQNGDQQRYLTKLSFAGETIWEKTYDFAGNDVIRGIALADNGDILLTGYKGFGDGGFSFIADDSEGYVMRVNKEGGLIWDKPISAPQGAKIRKTTNGYIICTTNWMNDATQPQKFYLIRLDEAGNELWAKSYGGDSDEHCYDCDVASDGGFILGGHTRSPSYGVVNWDYLLVKVDSEGKEEWHKTFGQPRGYDPKWIHDEAYGVRQTPDGGFVIVGGTGDEYPYSAKGHPRGASDTWQAYAVKVDGAGNTLWEGIYGSATSDDAGEYIGLTNDGGFIIGTDTDIGHENYAPNNFGFLKIK